VVDTDSIIGSLALEPVGPDRYRAANAESGHGIVFGGQLLGQSIVAGSIGHDGKRVKTVHTVFARAASPELPVEIAVDVMQSGRAFGSSTVTITQGERLCTRSLVLSSVEEPDFIRHGDVAAEVAPPPARAAEAATGQWEIEFVGGVDISDPDLVGPPDLDVWTRFPGAPEDPIVNQALLAFATDGFLIGASMRPHAGVGQAQAHRTVSTGVISHTLTFHEPVAASGWMLLSHHGVYAGHGRCYGRANVFRRDGVLAASFVQDGMIRPLDTSRSGPTL
jgi:acyl-CoA thioesterase